MSQVTHSPHQLHPPSSSHCHCLSFNEADRPSAQELCYCLADLNKAPWYDNSVQQAQERSTQVSTTELVEVENRERQITQLQQEKEEQDEQIQELQQLL